MTLSAKRSPSLRCTSSITDWTNMPVPPLQHRRLPDLPPTLPSISSMPSLGSESTSNCYDTATDLTAIARRYDIATMAPSTRAKSPLQTTPRDTEDTIRSPEYSSPFMLARRVRYILRRVSMNRSARLTAENSSPVYEYDSMVSSPASVTRSAGNYGIASFNVPWP
jgi:hypothetical protein